MKNELITVASIGLADFFNGQVYKIEKFVQQRKENFKKEHGIKKDDNVSFLDIINNPNLQYIGDAAKVSKMKEFEIAQKIKLDELRSIYKRVKLLQHEIIENCKILEGVNELI